MNMTNTTSTINTKTGKKNTNTGEKLICIVCPKSCEITVFGGEKDFSCEGNECKRGIEYARNESFRPKRLLTSTVKVSGGFFSRVGVVGTTEVPKDMLKMCLEELYRIGCVAPVHAGEVITENICGTGCDIIAAMSVQKNADYALPGET
jgi:CxxC motif-containing protein